MVGRRCEVGVHVVVLGLCFALGLGRTFAADAVDGAMRKASDYLVGKQDARGAIRENDSHETAMTALSLLGLAAVGHQPSEEGKHGDAMRKALGFILKEDRQDKDG